MIGNTINDDNMVAGGGKDVILAGRYHSQRQAAKKFKEFWLLAKDSETGGYSKFWLSLLSDVLGVDDVFSRIDFQSRHITIMINNMTAVLTRYWFAMGVVLQAVQEYGARHAMSQSGWFIGPFAFMTKSSNFSLNVRRTRRG
ncbi:MAG: hypothetical protein IKO72_10350 [Kiritimatiellae bacterium]|nr:hypothetical protein [Kiritimatiellia bacterium]